MNSGRINRLALQSYPSFVFSVLLGLRTHRKTQPHRSLTLSRCFHTSSSSRRI
jgi:hypothetical protein